MQGVLPARALCPLYISLPARAHQRILRILKCFMAVQEIQQDLDAGNLSDIYVRDVDSAGGPDIPLSDLNAMQQQELVEQEASPAADEDPDKLAGANAAAAGDLIAQTDPESLGHDRGPSEADLSESGLHFSSMPDGEEQQETLGSSADTDGAPVDDSSEASPSVRAHTKAEQGGGPADSDHDTKKLAKQQDLFGRSFRKPKRYALCLCVYRTSRHCCWTSSPSCLCFVMQRMACFIHCCTL